MEEEDNVDISQTKNLSLGGMWLTTNRKFEVGTKLALQIRLPLDPIPMILIGRVVGAEEVVDNLIYDTHLEFISVDEKHKDVIGKTVDFYLQKEQDKKEEEII